MTAPLTPLSAARLEELDNQCLGCDLDCEVNEDHMLTNLTVAELQSLIATARRVHEALQADAERCSYAHIVSILRGEKHD